MTTRSEQALMDLQRAFAASIRDPQVYPAPAGIPESRMAVYQNLFFANLSEALAGAFPVAHEVLPETLWETWRRTFWREHASKVPEYPRLPGEFLAWIGQSQCLDAAPDWALELLLWEHAELESMLAEDDPLMLVVDVMLEQVVLAASVRVFVFDWPVHRVSADWQPAKPEQTCLACYRTPDLNVDFITLTPASAALLSVLQGEAPCSGQYAVHTLAAHLQADVESLSDFARAFLSDLVARGVIVAAKTS